MTDIAKLAISKTANMKLVITGSPGHISKPLTEILVQQGHEIIHNKDQSFSIGVQAVVQSGNKKCVLLRGRIRLNCTLSIKDFASGQAT
jgi:hypothetical protein